MPMDSAVEFCKAQPQMKKYKHSMFAEKKRIQFIQDVSLINHPTASDHGKTPEHKSLVI